MRKLLRVYLCFCFCLVVCFVAFLFVCCCFFLPLFFFFFFGGGGVPLTPGWCQTGTNGFALTSYLPSHVGHDMSSLLITFWPSWPVPFNPYNYTVHGSVNLSNQSVFHVCSQLGDIRQRKHTHARTRTRAHTHAKRNNNKGRRRRKKFTH